MPNIQLQDFSLDTTVIPSEIYQWRRRSITSLGLKMWTQVRDELDRFIEEYLEVSGFPRDKSPFLRIDAYINPDGSALQILDINASFVDGWWNALNLTRAMGTSANQVLLEDFPSRLLLQEECYRPEFELAVRELELRWSDLKWRKRLKEVQALDSRVSTYVYGNPPWIQEENTYPYDALRMDNKRLLAQFSQIWKWTTVQVPKIYTPDSFSWANLPSGWVLKLISKKDIMENPQIRRVQIWVKKNNSSLRLLWDAGRLIVQENVATMKDNSGNNTQIIILATRKSVVGYTQFSPKSIINDDSIQWPLLLQS